MTVTQIAAIVPHRDDAFEKTAETPCMEEVQKMRRQTDTGKEYHGPMLPPRARSFLPRSILEYPRIVNFVTLPGDVIWL